MAQIENVETVDVNSNAYIPTRTKTELELIINVMFSQGI